MAPVYLALREIRGASPLVLLTGQHREQLEDGLRLFRIKADANLDLMVARQTLPELAARILPAVTAAFDRLKADYVLVHGDTLTTFAVAWAAYLAQIPVGHVEAGLRSHSLAEPFPEEANRRLTDVLTDLDLAPTRLARSNLIAEGKPADRIIVTGQTAVDAILHASRVGKLPAGLPQPPYVTITMHRRENWPILPALAACLARLARRHSQLTFVSPVHRNPIVREAVVPQLRGIDNLVLLDPLDYGSMAALLARSCLIVTDSGGLQEEGASLGVPVVVLRNVTERPEGVAAGIVRLAGTNPERVYALLDDLLTDPAMRNGMASAANPYGDGKAGTRVAAAVAWRLGLGDRPKDWNGITDGELISATEDASPRTRHA